MSFATEGSPQSGPAISEVSPGAASPEPASTPQSSPSTPEPSSPQPGAEPLAGGDAAAPAWAPSYKFKAAGKEHEIPEYLRGVMKDAETEKQLKELHEKAYGLDLVKNNYQTSQQQLQHIQKTVMPEYDSLKKSVNTVVNYKKNGDIESIMDYLGVPHEAVAKWMYQKLQAQELPPEQRALYERERQLTKQNYELTENVNHLSQSQEQYQLQLRVNELQAALAKPEVQQAADQYNARLAQPDAFWNFVCQQADYMERQSGKRVNADEAIQQTMRILGTSLVPSPAPGAVAPGAVAAGSPTPPIIPNVTGARNTSPVRKVARSTEDLRKQYAERARSSQSQ